VLSYFIYHVVGLRVPQRTMQHTLHRLFGFDLVHSTLNNLKIKGADYYSVTRQRILNRIIHGGLIHADETQANIKGHLAYVWVLTNLREVVYILAESREGEFIQDLLKDFKGVLVSDFYAAYDAIECPQQKCLIHFMRDLNDEILSNPFDEEMKSIVLGFAALLKPKLLRNAKSDSRKTATPFSLSCVTTEFHGITTMPNMPSKHSRGSGT